MRTGRSPVAAMAALAAALAVLAAVAPDAAAQSGLSFEEVTTRTIVGGEPAQLDAREDATISVSISASAPVNVVAADVSFFAESGDSRVAPSMVTGSGTEWEARLVVGEDHAEGPVKFWVTARAVAPETGMATATHEDVDGHLVEIDLKRPTMTAALASLTTTVVTLDEPLSPLVAEGRELDASRWCMTERLLGTGSVGSCVDPMDMLTASSHRDVAVSSATVTRTGERPQVTIEHGTVYSMGDMSVTYDPTRGDGPPLVTDSALNLPAARGGHIWAKPDISGAPPGLFVPLYWGSDDQMAVLLPFTIATQVGRLVPAEWRVEHGAATPGDASNDLALRPSDRAGPSTWINLPIDPLDPLEKRPNPEYDPDAPNLRSDRLDARLLHFADGVEVPAEDLYVTYTKESGRFMFSGGPELTAEPQIAPNPLTQARKLEVRAERDSGSGFAEIDAPARVGDRIAVDLELRGSPPAGETPMISFHGGSATAMTMGAGDRVWSAALAVGATTPEGPVAFTVTSSQRGAAAVSYSESGVTDGSSATVDRTAPQVRIARQVGDRELHVAFDEPVTHSSLTSLFEVRRGGAVVATTGTSVDAASGAYVTTLTANAPASSTHVLTTAAGAITDAAGNAAPTSITVMADTAAPSATALTVAVLREGEAGLAARTGPNAAHARPGDTVRVTMELDEETHARTVPTVRFFDQRTPVAMRGQPGDTSWAADHRVPPLGGAQGAPVYPDTLEGAVGFDIVALDYAGNSLEVSEAGTTDMSSASVDATPPAMPTFSFADDALSVTLEFAEELDASTVAAAFTVRDAGGAAVAQPSPPAYNAAARTVVVSLGELSSGRHTIEIAGTLTDRAGNAYGAGPVDLGVIDRTGPAVTGVATESATTTVVTLDEEVSLDGTAAQRARHWSVTDDDPDGDGPMAAPARAVSGVEAIGEDGAAADSGSRVRLTHALLSSTASTPTVVYSPVSDATPPTLGLVRDTVAPFLNPMPALAATEASDGAPPRADSAAFTGPATIALELSEPVEETYVTRASVTPGLGGHTANLSGTTLTIEGSRHAADGTVYTVAVPSLAADLSCAGAAAEDMCVPNAFSREAITVTHEDSYRPTLEAGSLSFPSASLAAFRVSEALDAMTLSGITIAPPLGTVTATQSGPEVRLAFTGTPVAGTEYTVSVPATVTDTASPPNAFVATSQAAAYAADTVAPTVASARLISGNTIAVEFSEPVSGTVRFTDWVIRIAPATIFQGAGLVHLNGQSPLDTSDENARGVNAPGRQSESIPAGSPVTEITLHFNGEPTDTVFYVQYQGRNLADRAGNLVTQHATGADSVRVEDDAPPEVTTLHVTSSRARQLDASDGFGAGTLLVKPGDTVRFDAVWHVIDYTQDQFILDPLTRLLSPTIAYFDPSDTHAMTQAGERTHHTFTVPAGAPEGRFKPYMTAVDREGNFGTFRQATAGIGPCNTYVAYSGTAPDGGLLCRPDNDITPANLALADRVFPVVDTTAPTVVSARTASSTETVVTLSEPVGHAAGTPAERAAHWTVTAGSPPATFAVASVADTRSLTLTLTHATMPTGATPTLSYSRGDDAGRVVDRVEHDLATIPASPGVRATDGAPPELVSAAFGERPSRTVTLEFSEALAPASVGPSTIKVEDPAGEPLAGTTVTHVAGMPHLVTVEFPGAAAAPDGVYTVRASGIRDTASPANRPAADLTADVTLNTAPPTIVSSRTALHDTDVATLVGFVRTEDSWRIYGGAGSAALAPPTTNPSTTTITLSEPVMASPGANNVPATPAQIGARWGLADASGTAVSITSAAVSGSTVTLTHAAPTTTAASLRLTYDASEGAGRIVDAVGEGLAAIGAGDGVVTGDGVAPLWTARLASTGSVLVSFSEPVEVVAGGATAWGISNKRSADNADMRIDSLTRLTHNDFGVSATTALSGVTRLTLDRAGSPPGHRTFSMTDLPWVKYYPGTPGFGSHHVADAAGNGLLPRAVQATDGIRPTLTLQSAPFDGTTITATASRALNTVSIAAADFALRGPGESTATITPSSIETTPTSITFTFSPKVTAPGLYHLELATDAQGMVTGDVRDTVATVHPGETTAGNLLDTAGLTVTVAPPQGSIPKITSIETFSPTLTRVTLSERVMGKTVPAQWSLQGDSTDDGERLPGGGVSVRVTGVAAGAVTSVAPACADATGEALTACLNAVTTITQAGAAITLTLQHAAQDTSWVPRLSYNQGSNIITADERLRGTTGTPLQGKPINSGPHPTDGAPPWPESATFHSASQIDLRFSETLHGPSVTTATYAVTDPSGTAVPLATANPVSWAQGSPTVTLNLASATTAHGSYGVAISGLRDVADPSNPCLMDSCDTTVPRTVTLPVASSLAVSVLDGETMAAKATAPETAAAGDIVRVRLELSGIRELSGSDPADEAPSAAALSGLETPMAGFYGAAPAEMADASPQGSPKSAWTADHTVPASPQREAAPEFSITATHGHDTLALTRADLTAGASVTVDTTPPSLSADAADALYTRTEAATATAGLGEAAPARAGARMLVVLTASEPLAGVAAADATINGAAATDIIDHAARSLAAALPANTYVYSRAVAAGEAEGAITFSVTARDAVGNAATFTQSDIADDSDAATGYLLSVDRTPPEVESLAFASRTSLALEFSEAVSGVPATLALERVEARGGAATGVTATVTHADGEAAVTLTVPEVEPFHPDNFSYRLTVPASVIDAAGNAYATPSQKVGVAATAPMITSVETLSTTQTRVTISAPVAALGTDAGMESAQIASHWRVNIPIVPTPATPPNLAPHTATAAEIGTAGAGASTTGTVTLTHEPLNDSDTLPTVTYDPAATAGRLVDAATGAFALAASPSTTPAEDSAPPEATARFTSPTEITVTADVAYSGTPALSAVSFPAGVTHSVTSTASPTVVITLGGTVTDGTYAFTVSLSDTRTPPNSGTASFSLDRDTATPTFATARTLSHTQVEVDFAEGTARAGTAALEAGRWTARPSDACGGMSGEVITATAVTPLAGGKVTLTLGAGMLDSRGDPVTDATPAVTYTRAGDAPAEFRNSVGAELETVCMVASDGAPPVPHTARTAGVGLIGVSVAMSEPVGLGSQTPGAAPTAIPGQFLLHPGGRSADAVAPSSFAISTNFESVSLTFPPTAPLNPVEAGTVVRYDGSLAASRATDAGGNAQGAALDVALVDGAPPRVASARTAGATTTEVEFDEPVSIVGNVAPLWTLTLPGDDTEYPASAAAVKPGSPEVLVLTHADADTPLTYAPASTATVEYDPEDTRNAVADLAGNQAAGHSADTGTPFGAVAVADGIAPSISSAATSSSTVTVVTLTEPASAASSTAANLARHWTVTETVDGAGVARAVSSAVISSSTVTLTHAALASTAATPAVAYAVDVDSDGDGDMDADDEATRIADGVAGAGNAMAAGSVTATDGAAPEISAEFSSATTIRVSLSEPISRTMSRSPLAGWSISTEADDGNALLATNPPAYAPGSGEREITLHLTTASAATSDHTVTPPPGITDRATPANAYGGSAVTAAGLDRVSFTARTTAADTIEVAFGLPVRRAAGSAPGLSTSAWEVHETDQASSGTITVTGVSDLADNKVTLTLAPSAAQMSTAKTPLVVYARDIVEIETTSGLGLVRGAQAVATDGAPPVITGAEAGSTTGVTVTLSEAATFMGSPGPAAQRSQWSVGADPFVAPSSVSLSGSTVTVAVAAASAWGTGAPPQVNYLELDDTASRRAALIVDAAGNRLADGSVASTDGIVPVIVGATELSTGRIAVTLSEAARFADGSSTAAVRGAHWTVSAGGTDRTAASAEISGSTVTITVAEMDRWRGGQMPTVSYTDTADGGRVTDASGNDMAAQGPRATVDQSAPELVSARTVDLRTTALVFSRPVAIAEGTGAQVTGHWAMAEGQTAVAVESVSADLGVSHAGGSSAVTLALPAPVPSGVHSVTARSTLASASGATLSSDQVRHFAHGGSPLTLESYAVRAGGATLEFNHDVDIETLRAGLTLSGATISGPAAIALDTGSRTFGPRASIAHIDFADGVSIGSRTPVGVTISETVRSVAGHAPAGELAASRPPSHTVALRGAEFSADGRSILIELGSSPRANSLSASVDAGGAPTTSIVVSRGLALAADPVHYPGSGTLVQVRLASQPPAGVHAVSVNGMLFSSNDVSYVPSSFPLTWSPAPFTLEGAAASADGRTVTLEFSEGLDTSTVTPSNIALSAAPSLTAGMISHADGSPTVAISLAAALPAGEHTATARAGVKASSGAGLGAEVARTFAHSASAPELLSVSVSADGRELTLEFSEALGASTVLPTAFAASEGLGTGGSARVTVGHGPLSGAGATPTISYDPATAAAGRLALAGPAATQVEAIPSTAVEDGIPPSLVGDPVLVGWTHGHPESATEPPNYGVQDSVRLEFDEPLSRDTLASHVLSSGMTRTTLAGPPHTGDGTPPVHALQTHIARLAAGILPGHDRFHALPPSEYYVADESAVDSISPWLPRSSWVLGAHLDESRKVLEIRVNSAVDHVPFALAFINSGAAGRAENAYWRDDAGNAYVPDASRGHAWMSFARDIAGPEFTASVDSSRQVRVVYNEPVEIKEGSALSRTAWRVDTTPGAEGGVVTPVALRYSFDEFESQDFVHHGDLGRQSRLTVLLEVGVDLNPAANLDVTYRLASARVADAMGNDAVAPYTYQYRPGGSAPAGLDAAAPEASSLSASVERPQGEGGAFAARAGQFAHHAREGDRVRVTALLDEPVPLAASSSPRSADAIVPRLSVDGPPAAMDAVVPPAFSVVIPEAVTDQDGTAFAAGTAHAVSYAPSAPAFSNARFDAPTRMLLDVSEPLDDTTLTADTPATGDAALVEGSVHVEGLGTLAVHREMGKIVVTTREPAVPGTSYTVRIAGTVTDADGVAAAPASLSAEYPVEPELTARFTSIRTIAIGASEWLDYANVNNFSDSVHVALAGEAPRAFNVFATQYVHPYLVITLGANAQQGTYEVTLPEGFLTSAGTPVPRTVSAELHAGSGLTPPGAPEASNVRFFGPRHIQLDLDQQPATATLAGIGVPVLGVESWSRDGLTVTLALGGRADRVAWEGEWIVPAADSDGEPFGGELDFGVMAADGAGNVSDIGPESQAEGVPRVFADTAAPAFSASTVSGGRTSVTFDEPVRGVVTASEWCVGGAAATGVSSDGVEFSPALLLLDGPGVAAGQTVTLAHAPPGGAEPAVAYRPSGQCSPGAPSG